MMRMRWFGPAAALGAVLLASAPAVAKDALASAPAAATMDVRAPVSGTPAFDVSVPAGWMWGMDPFGNLHLTRANRSAVVQLRIVDGEDAKRTYPDLAAEILESAGATPFTGNAPSSIAGITGESFDSSMVAGGMRIDLELVLARLDAGHVASLALVKPVGIADADLAAMKALLARVKLVRD
ncbi:MAG TPA: hypothetical protein VFO61_06120 [Alphaproteobacteria bacterium]|nr:hypothetical protein [Alphaproteobacteria bacterium]